MPKGSKAARWNPLLYGGMRGDVPTLYVFALVQLTRFRPVRGVLRTASTDSCLLLQLRRIRNIYRITNVSHTQKFGGFITVCFSTVIATPVTDVTGVAIRSPFSTHCVIWKTLRGADCHVARVLLAMTSKDRRHYRNLGSAARRAHGSSALVHAMRDLIASNALLRTRRHKARPVSCHH